MPGKLNQPNRSVTATARAGEAPPEPGSTASIVISKGWAPSSRSVVEADTVSADSAVVSWEVSRTVYGPAAPQACEGAAVVAEAPSPKSHSQEDAGEEDVSRSRTVWPATGFGGSTSKVTAGDAPARERRSAAEAGTRTARTKRSRRFMDDSVNGGGAASRPPPAIES